MVIYQFAFSLYSSVFPATETKMFFIITVTFIIIIIIVIIIVFILG